MVEGRYDSHDTYVLNDADVQVFPVLNHLEHVRSSQESAVDLLNCRPSHDLLVSEGFQDLTVYVVNI